MEIKDRQKLLAIVAISGLVLLAADRFVLTPLIDSWKARSARIEKLKTSIADGSRLLTREHAIRDRWEAMKTNTLPENASLAESEMLKACERWSQQSGISVSAIKPQWRQKEEDYSALECRADASGNMNTLARFLFEVEKDPMALRVEAVEISSRDNKGQQLTLALQLSGLLLTPAEK